MFGGLNSAVFIFIPMPLGRSNKSNSGWEVERLRPPNIRNSIRIPGVVLSGSQRNIERLLLPDCRCKISQGLMIFLWWCVEADLYHLDADLDAEKHGVPHVFPCFFFHFITDVPIESSKWEIFLWKSHDFPISRHISTCPGRRGWRKWPSPRRADHLLEVPPVDWAFSWWIYTVPLLVDHRKP